MLLKGPKESLPRFEKANKVGKHVAYGAVEQEKTVGRVIGVKK